MEKLDNCLVAHLSAVNYLHHMNGITLRDRIRQEMERRDMNVAELSRISGVPYHTLDKYLKRENAKTSGENAQALANALGIKQDGEVEYEELREIFFQIEPKDRETLLKIAKNFLG